MHVHLKQGDKIEIVPNVTLQDGYRPVVDGVAPSSPTTDGTFHIESALWYKTILLDSVYIDCDEREVYWLRKETTVAKTIDDECENQNRFVPVGAETLHSDVDVYDFDPTTDELADRANECMTNYADKKISWIEFRSEVTRLLHCYIFPAIKFQKDDGPALQDALLQVESKSQLVEAEILKKSKSVDLTENSLQQMRTRILESESFDSELYVRSCRKEFLSLLYKDVEKEITRLNSELEGIQLQVNKYRDCNVSEGTKLKLQDLRKKRDEFHEQTVSMQVVRETLRNVLFRPVIRKKKWKKIKIKDNVFHEIYMEVNERLQQQKESLQRSCLAKVKISSVREAVFSAFSDVKTSDGQECSVRFTDGSEFSLDIIGFNSRPEGWKTLEEKVYSCLQDNKSPAFRKHYQACKMIMDKVESAIDDTRMFGASTESCEGLWQFVTSDSMSSTDVKFVETVGGFSRKRREGHTRSMMYSPDLVDEMDPMAVDALKKSLERIKEDIKDHMETMCSLLIKTIPECEKRHRNKLWVSYENVFYLEILPHLCNLYELTHAPRSIHLFRKISSLSLHDLLDDNILNIILSGVESGIHLTQHPRRWRGLSAGSEDFEILNPSIRDVSRSCVSLEIRKCTLQELYNMADRECHQLTGSIPNMFDTGACSPPVSEPSDVTVDDDASDSVNDSEADVEDVFVEDEEIVDPRELLGEMFAEVKTCLQASFKAKTILEKLRRLTKVFRLLGDLLSDLNKNAPMACCDEMLSMIIVLLRCIDEETFVCLYSSVMLMIDLRAPFLNGSVHDCSLTNFFGAFDYLFSSQLCKKKESPDSSEEHPNPV